MASPDPTYDDGLVLIDQPLQHSSIAHIAHVTYACADTASQTAQQLADEFQTAFNDAFGAQFDTEVTVLKPTALRGDGTTTPSVAIASGSTVEGTSDFTGPPPSVAVLFKKVTSLAGRANRGRTYMPFIAGDDSITETGHLQGDILTAGPSDASALLAALAAADMPMCICNREIAANPTPPPATYVSAYHTGAIVTQYLMELVVATQRRRLVRT